MGADKLEQSVQDVTRAYPPRYRRARGAELHDLLVELVPEGAQRVPREVTLDVLVGGIRYRLQDRPPTVRRWAYRWFDARLDPRWAEWVRDDIDHWSYPIRRARVAVPAAIAFAFAVRSADRAGANLSLLPWMFVVMFVTMVCLSVVQQRRIRGHARRRHLLTVPTPPAARPFLRAWTLPARRQVWPLWACVSVVWLAASPVIAWTLATVPPQRTFGGNSTSVEEQVGHVAGPAAVAASVAGLVLLAATFLRLRRRLATRGIEPNPDSRWVTMSQLAAVAGISVAVAALSWLAAWADFEPGVYAIFTATIGLIAGPTMLTAALAARRQEHSTGAAVTTRELILAAFARRPLSAPQPAMGIIFAPTTTPRVGD